MNYYKKTQHCKLHPLLLLQRLKTLGFSVVNMFTCHFSDDGGHALGKLRSWPQLEGEFVMNYCQTVIIMSQKIKVVVILAKKRHNHNY